MYVYITPVQNREILKQKWKNPCPKSKRERERKEGKTEAIHVKNPFNRKKTSLTHISFIYGPQDASNFQKKKKKTFLRHSCGNQQGRFQVFLLSLILAIRRAEEVGLFRIALRLSLVIFVVGVEDAIIVIRRTIGRIRGG
jgi:hypothetical protein